MKNTKKYFTATDDWEYNSRISRFDNEWILYGEGYRLAIELLEKHVLEIDRTDQDFLIYPYCFMIRHYIEIRLKEVITEGAKFLGTTSNVVKNGHDLIRSWDASEQTLQRVYPGQYQAPPSEYYNLIKELNDMDKGADGFRFPFTRSGDRTLKETNVINFKHLSKEFLAVKHYLDGITDGLAVLLDPT